MGFERPLETLRSVEHFFTECLPKNSTFVGDGLSPISIEEAINKVESAEKLFQKSNAGCTFEETNYRFEEYRSPKARERLRRQILDELATIIRLEDDEKIVLGHGGAKPVTSVKFDQQAYLLTGLPASGKSGIAAKVCDAYGAFLVDPDYAKRKIPEYRHNPAGATRVHKESMQLALGSEDPGTPNLLSFCVESKANFVRPLIGDEAEKLDTITAFLNDQGYSVHLCLVELDRTQAVLRALNRFLKTDRYVSLPYIFDDCANDAALVYYRYRALQAVSGIKQWASFGAISTSGPAPVKIDASDPCNPAQLF